MSLDGQAPLVPGRRLMGETVSAQALLPGGGPLAHSSNLIDPFVRHDMAEAERKELFSLHAEKLDGEAEAVFAVYEAWDGEALVLAAAYPDEALAARVFARFGLDFFPGEFDPDAARHLARLETGDWAAAARTGRVLVVVLEAPDRETCEALLGRLEERATGFGR